LGGGIYKEYKRGLDRIVGLLNPDLFYLKKTEPGLFNFKM
jgi:hypothetical protein